MGNSLIMKFQQFLPETNNIEKRINNNEEIVRNNIKFDYNELISLNSLDFNESNSFYYNIQSEYTIISNGIIAKKFNPEISIKNSLYLFNLIFLTIVILFTVSLKVFSSLKLKS